MGQDQGSGSTSIGAERAETPEQLRDDIERTRQNLGDTVAALAAKADVKARARQTAGTAKAWMRDKASNGPQIARQRARHMTEIAPHRAAEAGRVVRRHPVPAALAVCAAVALLIMGLRRRYR